MIGVFGNQDTSKQAGARPAAFDRPGWQRRRVDSLAACTVQARTDDSVHHEALRHVFQFFGNVLAEMLQTFATPPAGLAWRQHLFIVRKMLG